MRFIKYPEIENTYRQEFIDRIITEQKAGGVWVVTEKIHGANFSFWCDGKTVRMAKRSCLLPDDANFYGVQTIREYLYTKVMELYTFLQKIMPIEQLAVYGELFGGAYKHPDVEANFDVRKVQKGVEYSPHIHFMAYDIRVDEKWLDFEIVQDACSSVGIPVVEALMYGSMGDCLAHANDFQSTIAARFGLPPIEGNICEGVVIRPCKTQYVFNHKRVMLKNKNDKFKEKGRAPRVRVKQHMSKKAVKCLKDLLKYVTENRYNSVVSKIGEVQPKDFGRVQGEFAKDVLEEFAKDKRYKAYTQLEKEERKVLNKAMNHAIAQIVRKKLIIGE